MRDLILKTLRESVKAYPELKGYLSDEALILTWIKVGEAPDDKVRLRDERLLKRKLTKFLEGQKSRILTYIRTHDMKAIQPSFWDDEIQKMWAELGEDFVGIMLHGVEGGIDILPGHGTGFAIDQDKINMRLVNYAKQYRDKWLEKIEDTSRGYVDQHITNWLLSGDPLPVLINALKEDTTGMFKEPRATRIAVTETTRLHALGNKMAWEETDYIKKWKWMTAQDELVCDICREGNAGGPYPLSQLDEKLPAHVNCRCWSQPIVEVGEVSQEAPMQGLSFATNKEAENYARSLGITHAKFSSVDMDAVNEWLSALTYYKNNYPKLFEKMQGTGTSTEALSRARKLIINEWIQKHPDLVRAFGEEAALRRAKQYANSIVPKTPSGCWAMSIESNATVDKYELAGVYLNKNNFKGHTLDKLLEYKKDEVEMGFHPNGTATIRSDLDHEIGHQLDYLLGVSKDKGFIDSLFEGVDNKYSYIKSDLSSYAASSTSELIAEAWSQYTNANNPGVLSQKIGNYIVEKYRSVYP